VKDSNPCLNVLVRDWDCPFKPFSMLSEEEQYIRAAVFTLLFGILFGSFYGHLIVNKQLTKTCDKFLGALLQPYLYSFLSVFFFKILQYIFETLLADTSQRSTGFKTIKNWPSRESGSKFESQTQPQTKQKE